MRGMMIGEFIPFDDTNPDPEVAQDGAKPHYREGRRNLSVWLEAEGFNQFKAMVFSEGGQINDYLIDMINREFVRKGKPPIARK